MLKTELDFEDGVMVYEVEFVADGYEYEYEIDAADGTVRKSERERDDGRRPSGQSPSSSGEYLTADKAKQIACEHADVPFDGIWAYSIDFERDDGWSIYEIEFKYDGYEYDYEINAFTGDILKSEREYDGSSRPSGSGTEEGGILSADKAKQAALQHAGLAAEDCLLYTSPSPRD